MRQLRLLLVAAAMFAVSQPVVTAAQPAAATATRNAEDARLTDPLDQVTARAVSAFRKLIPLTAPLLRDGGELVLMKGAGAAAEVEAATKELRKFRVHDVEVLTLGEDLLDDVTRVIRAQVR